MLGGCVKKYELIEVWVANLAELLGVDFLLLGVDVFLAFLELFGFVCLDKIFSVFSPPWLIFSKKVIRDFAPSNFGFCCDTSLCLTGHFGHLPGHSGDFLDSGDFTNLFS